MPTARERALADALLPLADDRDLDPLLDAIGDRRLVLLGEASHGTHEFYTWRERLSRRLIAERGFSFIAVEGDWPDCYRLNQFVKGRKRSVSGHGEDGSAREALLAFDRWPTWMWANHEVEHLLTWLRAHNDGLPEERRAGFFGLDLYSLWTSLGRVLAWLEERGGSAVTAARDAVRCFEPYGEDVHDYARATALVPTSCEDEIVALLREVRAHPVSEADHPEDRFSVEQDARAAVGAERYYRTMVQGDRESWNVRDTHMVDTLDRLLSLHDDLYGARTKAIVWAHNTHVGDARATPMGLAGMVNVGQLARDLHGDDDTFIVGFASHRGEVIAGKSWDAPMERMTAPPARDGSLEALLHQAAARDGLLLLPDVANELGGTLPHRAIGVVYAPVFDDLHNYVPSRVPERYDALVYLDETRALEPLGLAPRPDREPPETWPTAM